MAQKCKLSFKQNFFFPNQITNNAIFDLIPTYLRDTKSIQDNCHFEDIYQSILDMMFEELDK